jgi:hypothetical protein
MAEGGFYCVKDLKTDPSYALPVSFNMRVSRTQSIPRGRRKKSESHAEV